MRRLSTLLPVLITLAGCGGGTGDSTFGGNSTLFRAFVNPSSLAPGGTAAITTYQALGNSFPVEFSVEEGATGGLVVANADPMTATYTAPAAIGTYHIVVRFLKDGNEVALRKVTVFVR